MKAVIVAATGLSSYAVRVLLEAGLGLQFVWRREGGYPLGKLGRFLLEDEMTRETFDFTRDICYQAAACLNLSVIEGHPFGQQTLGQWANLYEGSSDFPEPAQRSWHALDRYSSDRAFPVVCKRLAHQLPACRLDIGCNTGQWAESGYHTPIECQAA
ncbi:MULTISPECIES: hypothetical protein [Caldimonas]|uniref:hypothetical protein n=1 Tax=Caldimonas TaxID=196013 RepID=UPI000780CC14|nr:hypothetical protein [Caldimonas taiwanensis]MCX7659788.1 hypothetical protein [Caldimonas manganoxidans]